MRRVVLAKTAIPIAAVIGALVVGLVAIAALGADPVRDRTAPAHCTGLRSDDAR